MRNGLPVLHTLWVLLLSAAAGMAPMLAQAPGTITTIAGNGAKGFGGDGGPASAAMLNTPSYLAFGRDGGYYIADLLNYRVRRVDANGVITTVAGNGVKGYSGDGGPAVNAQLSDPTGVAVDSQGNFFIADAANNRIRKVDANGTITTVAGTGGAGFSGDGGAATAAMLQCPTRVAFDGFDNMYIADQCNHRIRKVDRNGIITTIAGSGTPGAAFGAFSGDGGPATAAQLKHPTSVTVDRGGNLYVTDQLNYRIRRIDRSGTIRTIIGTGADATSGDGGPAIAASTRAPGVVAVDAAGNVYFADDESHRTRRIGTDGIVTTIIGNGTASSTGDGGPASAATVNDPFGIALDPFGDLYVVESGGNRIRKVSRLAPVVPTFPSAGITNGASFRPGAIPGGGIVTIFGLNFSNADRVLTAPGTPLPTELGGTSVRIGGVLAPLFAVVRRGLEEQINLQIPLSLAAALSPIPPSQAQQFTEVVVTSNGVSNAPVLMQLGAAQPGIFVPDFVNGAILHGLDNTPVSPQSPAVRGEAVVVYGTGLGAVENPPAAGVPAPAVPPLSPTLQRPTAMVGGVGAEVFFAGLAPNYVGLYQVNLFVPQSTPSGSVDVVITMNGVSSNAAKMQVQ